MPCNAWINRYVKGKTFVDVGGLWNTLNERVTIAAKAGASQVTMVDAMDESTGWWAKFHDRCKQYDVVCERNIIANVDAPDFAEKTGRYDMVHCSGIIYHCPNPLYSVSQLASIANEILILGSTRIPNTLTNSKGTIKMETGSALYVPTLNLTQKAVLAHSLQEVGSHAFGITHPTNWALNNYDPWWYIFTDRYIEGLINACGFEVLDAIEGWGGRSKYFLSKRVQAPTRLEQLPA